MQYLGDYPVGAFVYFKWSTSDVGGASITRGTDGTLRIYKDESDTQRTSSSGINDVEDFDSLTGLHHAEIDLGDNDDPGFFEAGHEYTVVLVGAVIDGKTVNAPLAHFSIERNPLPDTYQAKVWMQDDNGGGADHYSAVWFKNSVPVFSGITSPKIQVIKDSDGSDLIAEDDMTEIGSTGMYKYDEASARMVSGESYKIVVTATIDGGTRTWVQGMGRDSA